LTKQFCGSAAPKISIIGVVKKQTKMAFEMQSFRLVGKKNCQNPREKNTFASA